MAKIGSTRFNFGVRINPADRAWRNNVLNNIYVRISDTHLREYQRLIKRTMQKEAPKRKRGGGGALRKGIKSIPFKLTKSGAIDRRVNIRVVSTAPHTIYVTKGAKPNTQMTANPGHGRFLPQAGGRGPYRLATGFWPGFKKNDFIARTAAKLGRRNFGARRVTDLWVRTLTKNIKQQLKAKGGKTQ